MKPIHNEADYKAALQRLEQIFESRPGTPEGDELEVLGMLVDEYERKSTPIDAPDPIEAILFRMDQMGYSQKDLEEVLGLKSRASEILNRKRKLNLSQIRKIHEAFHIPAEVLIRAY
jgi:HTH-type transcriptional regulator/antitoxin HigA